MILKFMVIDTQNMTGSLFEAHKIVLSQELYNQIKTSDTIYIGK